MALLPNCTHLRLTLDGKPVTHALTFDLHWTVLRQADLKLRGVLTTMMETASGRAAYPVQHEVRQVFVLDYHVDRNEAADMNGPIYFNLASDPEAPVTVVDGLPSSGEIPAGLTFKQMEDEIFAGLWERETTTSSKRGRPDRAETIFIDPVTGERLVQVVVIWSRMRTYQELGLDRLHQVGLKYERAACAAMNEEKEG